MGRGPRPEARQLPLAPASLGTPSSTALDLFNAVDRRHLAGDVFTLVDTVTGPTRYPLGIEDNTHRALLARKARHRLNAKI